MTAAFKIAETESQFQSRIMEYATLRGWSWMHINKAQNAAGYWRTPVVGLLGRGFHDLFLVRGDRIVSAECKSEKGYMTTQQRMVADLLQNTGKVEVYVWRPEDWEKVMEILK
jgi:hypothetical protein